MQEEFIRIYGLQLISAIGYLNLLDIKVIIGALYSIVQQIWTGPPPPVLKLLVETIHRDFSEHSDVVPPWIVPQNNPIQGSKMTA